MAGRCRESRDGAQAVYVVTNYLDCNNPQLAQCSKLGLHLSKIDVTESMLLFGELTGNVPLEFQLK